MMESLSVFWNSLHADLRNLITGAAAGLASQYLSSLGKDKSDDLAGPLGEAYQAGILRFVRTIKDKNVDLDHIQTLLKDEGVKSAFQGMVQGTLPINQQCLENSLKNAGIALETIEDFDGNAALSDFCKGFLEKAESSRALQELLTRLEIRKISNLLEEHIKEKKPDLVSLKKKYIDWLKEKYSVLSFKGLMEKGFIIAFPLEEIYTPLSFAKELPDTKEDFFKEKEEMEKRKILERHENKEIKELSEVLRHGFAVITGDPGAGKSTILKYIALAFAENEQKKRLKWEDPLFPVLFPVSAYADRLKDGSGDVSLEKYLPEYFEKQHGLFHLGPLFADELRKRKALFLFDGLDEVADEDERRKMVARITGFLSGHRESKCRAIVTCRSASYTRASRFEKIGGDEFVPFSVLPFGPDSIKEFLRQWYRLYERDIHKKINTFKQDAEKDLERIFPCILENENIRAIAANPLMLTMLVLIEHEGGELPRNRADLYAKCLRMFAGLWEGLRSVNDSKTKGLKLPKGGEISEDKLVNILGPVAWEMLEKAMPVMEYEDLKERLSKKFDSRNKDMVLSKEQSDEFLQVMKEGSGLLQEAAPKVYGFMHQTFKEYLAARVLTDLSEDRVQELGDKLFTSEWREVVLLSASSLKKMDASRFIGDIFRKEDGRFRNIMLAGLCLLDVNRDRVDDALYDEITEKMKEAAFEDFVEDVETRAQIGEILGRLGDTRDLKSFVAVKGGTYQLEDLGKTEIKPFEMGKFPVTNQWFEEFYKADGYKNRDFWTPEGRKWLDYTKVDRPGFWDERKWKCPNSPVVGVSWYEADAFCKWLTAHDKEGRKYFLPDERQWQAAAAGENGRKYPWEGEWDKAKCNNGELKLNRTSPVGIFSQGNTPEGEGIADMAGNVWEWTRSDFHSRKDLGDFRFDEEMQKLWEKRDWDKYFDKAKEKERQLPVLRGGSWINDADDCRCAYRLNDHPVDRDGGIGFRCARTL